MTENEARNLLNERFESEKKREILIKINGENFSITPEQIEAMFGAIQEELDIQKKKFTSSESKKKKFRL